MLRAVSFLAASVCLASAASAQEPITGVPPFSSIQVVGPETINRQNLNANLSIPIVARPGRGFSFNFPIVNDSLLWMKSSTSAWTPVVDPAGNPTWGWHDSMPVGTTKYIFNHVYCDTYPPTNSPHYFDFSYTDPAGTIHKFNVDFYQTATACGFNTGPRTGGATDGSGYVIDATSPGGLKITAKDGTVVTGTNWTDANGNFVSATIVNSSENDWKDSAGHTSLKVITSSTAIQYQIPDNTGTYQTSTLKLTSTSIKTNFACAGVGEYTGTANLPTELDLPNGQKYLFTYEATPGQTGYYTGRLKRVTLPAGGYIENQYPGTNDSINCNDASVTNLTTVVNDGTTSSTWQFTRAANGSNWNSTVAAPQLPYDTVGNQSVFTFNPSGQEITKKFYQGTTTGRLLRTVNTTWSGVSPATQITVLEDNSTQSEIETTYDGYGNLTVLKEHDWGTGTPGNILRITTTMFKNTSSYIAANVVNLPITITVADGTGAVKGRTDINYDESGYINTSCPTGITQHNDTYGCSYTTRGNATTITTYTDPVTPAGPIVKHRYYDFFGNLVKADVNCCQQKQWTYSATTNYAFPDSIVSGSSTPQLTVSTTYNSYTGLVLSSTDENGKQTNFDYTDPGHLNRLMTTTRPDGTQITNAYDDVNFTVQTTSPVQGSNVIRKKVFVDGLNRTIKQQVLDASNTSYSITETKYDPVDRAYETSNPHNSTAQYWTVTDFDAIGRVTKTILPDSSNSVASYALNTVTVTDQAGKQRKSITDGVGRLISVYEPDVANANALTVQTNYVYTVLDSLTSVTQGAQTRTFLYDALGRLTDSTTPEAGHFQYQYNNYDLIVQRTDARGVVTTYGYDSLNRPYTVTYNVGVTGVASPGNITFTYGTNSTINNNGRIITMSDGIGSENYSYDTFGRTTQVQKIIGGTTFTVNYAYNLNGELSSITYPSGRVAQQSLDSIGRLCAVGASGSTCTTGTIYANGFNYNPGFQVTGFNYGNGVAAAFGISLDRLQVASLSYTKNGSNLFSLNYSYGPASSNNGQILGITDNVDAGRSATYSYDALYRLTNATSNGSASYPKWGLNMVYDRYGNRSQQSAASGCVLPMTCPTNSVTIDPAHNRVTGSPYAYDANGNMTDDGQNVLAYDAENHTVSSSGSLGSGTYTYDGNGLRVKKVSGSNSTVYVFSNSKVLAEYVNGAALTSPTIEYLYSGSALLAKVESGATKYYHQDLLSNRLVTDSTGVTLAQLGHFPYGESWYNGSGDKLLFTSYERDSESGNDFALARYSLSRLGRFSSPDPFPSHLSAPQSLNRYTYALNDPCDLADPLGLSPPCNFKIKIANSNLLSADQLNTAETEINKILGALGSGLSAEFNTGTPDFTATLKIANNGFWDSLLNPVPSDRYGINDAGLTDNYVNSAHVYTNNIKNNFPNINLGLTTGRVIAHEFGHWGLQVSDYGDHFEPNPQTIGTIMERGDAAIAGGKQDFFDPTKSIPTLQKLCASLRKNDTSGPGGGGASGGGFYFFPPSGPTETGWSPGGFYGWVWTIPSNTSGKKAL